MDYTYNQLIVMDVKYGGLTKKQAVNSRTLDRRVKKAVKNIKKNHICKCRMERRIWDDIGADVFVL